MNKLLTITPRMLAIACIGFISVFSLDVFTGVDTVPVMILHFFIHLIPGMILLIPLIIAWEDAPKGGVLFMLFSFYFLLNNNPTGRFLFFPLLFIIGALFLLSAFRFSHFHGRIVV